MHIIDSTLNLANQLGGLRRRLSPCGIRLMTPSAAKKQGRKNYPPKT